MIQTYPLKSTGYIFNLIQVNLIFVLNQTLIVSQIMCTPLDPTKESISTTIKRKLHLTPITVKLDLLGSTQGETKLLLGFELMD